MRRIAVVVALVVAASVWPLAAGVAHGATVAQAAPTQSLQADFNNDGADDLAVGVLYGSAGGLTTAGGQLFTQNSPGVPGGAEDDDLFGDALVSGDPGPSPAAAASESGARPEGRTSTR